MLSASLEISQEMGKHSLAPQQLLSRPPRLKSKTKLGIAKKAWHDTTNAMEILEQLGLALGLASLAGVNLYLTVLLSGVLVHFNLLHLADKYQDLAALGHPWVIAVAGALFLVEFFADKVPWVDSLWDGVHTFIRPVGGTLLALQAVGEMPPHVQVIAGLLAGGAALTTHTAKAGTRLLVNHSPEPVSNVALSVGEDAAVVGGSFLVLLLPVVAFFATILVLVALWLILPRLWRALRASAGFFRSQWRALSGAAVPPPVR